MAAESSIADIEKAAEQTLRSVFGFSDFLPGQRKAVVSVLEGNDVVVRMLDHAGKTLCYQLPIVTMGPSASAMIVSPLKALMKDQVHSVICRQLPVYRFFQVAKLRSANLSAVDLVNPEQVASLTDDQIRSCRFCNSHGYITYNGFLIS